MHPRGSRRCMRTMMATPCTAYDGRSVIICHFCLNTAIISLGATCLGGSRLVRPRPGCSRHKQKMPNNKKTEMGGESGM